MFILGILVGMKDSDLQIYPRRNEIEQLAFHIVCDMFFIKIINEKSYSNYSFRISAYIFLLGKYYR